MFNSDLVVRPGKTIWVFTILYDHGLLLCEAALNHTDIMAADVSLFLSHHLNLFRVQHFGHFVPCLTEAIMKSWLRPSALVHQNDAALGLALCRARAFHWLYGILRNIMGSLQETLRNEKSGLPKWSKIAQLDATCIVSV